METGEIVTLKEESSLIDPKKSIQMTMEMKDLICDAIRDGRTIHAISQDPGFPSLTAIYSNRIWDPRFDRAIRESYKHRAETFHDMAIDAALSNMGAHKDAIPGIKMAIDTLKWAAEKNDPGRFASKEVSSGNTGIQIIIDTGVGKTTPTDIQINELGEFLGFGGTDGAQEVIRGSGGTSSASEPIELGKDRWREVGGASDTQGRDTGEQGREEASEPQVEESIEV